MNNHVIFAWCLHVSFVFQFESSKKYLKAVQRCRENEQITHKTIAKRKKAIEERKEYLENVQKEKVCLSLSFSSVSVCVYSKWCFLVSFVWDQLICAD